MHLDADENLRAPDFTVEPDTLEDLGIDPVAATRAYSTKSKVDLIIDGTDKNLVQARFQNE